MTNGITITFSVSDTQRETAERIAEHFAQFHASCTDTLIYRLHHTDMALRFSRLTDTWIDVFPACLTYHPEQDRYSAYYGDSVGLGVMYPLEWAIDPERRAEVAQRLALIIRRINAYQRKHLAA